MSVTGHSSALANRAAPSAEGGPGPPTVCPLCGCATAPARKIREFTLFGCERCGHLFLPADQAGPSREELFGDTYFSGDPHGYPDYLAEEALQRTSARHYLRILARQGVRPGAMVDLGCAAGFQIDEFRRAGWNAAGVEPNLAMAGLARQRFGIAVHQGDVSTWNPAPASLDLVLILQVLEHLPDPADALARVHRGLANNGLLLVETWDREAWGARLFGDRWHQYNPPSVLHWFSRTGFRQWVTRCGFQVVRTGLPAKRIRLSRGVGMLRASVGNGLAGRLLVSPLGLLPAECQVPYFLGDAFWCLLRRVSR